MNLHPKSANPRSSTREIFESNLIFNQKKLKSSGQFENVLLNDFCPTLETIQRDFSPVNQRDVYDPWGRSGAGAPIKDPEGQIQTRTAGKVAHDSSVSIELVRFSRPIAKKQYLLAS